MTRTVLLLTACGLAFAASPRPENSTYVDGNVSTLKPKTGGTLVFSDDAVMMFKTPDGEVPVPYANIRRAELGPTQVHSHDAPAYKVWTLPQRLRKTETQLLTVEFRNSQGQDQTMTLELAKVAANDVLVTIQDHTVNKHDTKQDWWGDDYWKTKRNLAKWNSQTASVTK